MQCSQVMLVMRGLPGSGKSTVVRIVLETFPQAVVCSADSFFQQGDSYHFDPALLKDAHNFSQQTCEEACQRGENLIVVDNTNVKRWEMSRYYQLADQYSYTVLVVEPRTPWRYDPKELVLRNSHGVSMDIMKRRLAEYEVFNPRYLGWFLNPADSRQLMAICSDWLLKLLNMSQEFYHEFCGLAGSEEVAAMLSYYTRNNCAGSTRTCLHCTAKFFRKGDSTDFITSKAVVSSLGLTSQVEVVGITFTPRTMGARIRLSPAQLELWDQDDDESPRANPVMARPPPHRGNFNRGADGGGGSSQQAFPFCLSSLSLGEQQEQVEVVVGGGEQDLVGKRRGRRAHFTIGTAGEVAPVQTGLDLLDLLRQLEEDSSSGQQQLVMGGQLLRLGLGRWYLHLAQPLRVNALFTGCY